MEGVPAGNYELNVSVELPNQGRRTPATKQQVTVTDGTVSEVTLTVDSVSWPINVQFSVQSLCSLCLRGELRLLFTTETRRTQR